MEHEILEIEVFDGTIRQISYRRRLDVSVYNISSRLVANRQQFSWKQSKTEPDQSLFLFPWSKFRCTHVADIYEESQSTITHPSKANQFAPRQSKKEHVTCVEEICGSIIRLQIQRNKLEEYY
jgi:hypothetical protein